MGNYVKLIMVTDVNNNKFYEMSENSDGTFLAKWGRVGGSFDTKNYPMRDWNKKYNEKVRKGYEDVTKMCTVAANTRAGFKTIEDSYVNNLISILQNYSKNAIKENYIVSSATQIQFDTAQELLTKLNSIEYTNINDINELLIKLFKIIPRKMSKVNDFLYNESSKEKLATIYNREQSLLDILSTQIKTDIVEQQSENDCTILEALGLTVKSIRDTISIEKIKKLLGEIAYRFVGAYEISNNKTASRYNKYFNTAKNKDEMLLWHGSRNENWWGIIQTGLMLRPNAIITGKMLGEGLYYAPTAKKSEGYTSLNGSYWAKGSDRRGFMSLYNVHVGNIFHVNSYINGLGSMNYSRLREKGDYDSLYAHKSSGFLYNDEICIYREEQVDIRYIVELK